MARVSGREKIAISDIGPLILDYLSKEQIHSYEDLARINPYDSKLRFLGEKLVSWVNQARNILAEETIRHVDVNDRILVTSSKFYERDLTQKCVLTRLGMYELYLQVHVRDLPEAYEFEFSISPEHERYALGPWLEYKQNARTYQSILVQSKEIAAPQAVQLMQYTELLSMFGRSLLDVGQVKLAKELLIHLLFADKVHCLIIGEPSSPAKSSLASLLSKFALTHVRHSCGDKTGGEILSEKAAAVRPGVIIVEKPDLATAGERQVLQQIMSDQAVTISSGGRLVTYPVKASVYAYGSPVGGEWKNISKASKVRSQIPIPVEMLKNFHCVLLTPAYTLTELEKIARSLHSLTTPSEADANSLRSYMQAARELQPDLQPAPESVILLLTSLHKQRKRLAIPVTPQIERGIFELAKARARMRLSKRLVVTDFEVAVQLMKSALATCGYVEKQRRR